jgi:phosphonate transport system substrate-binding protein
MFLRYRFAQLMVVWLLGVTASYGADRNITVGLVIDGASQEDRQPMMDYLTKAMGQPVVVASPDNYKQTVSSLADESYDFACLGALVYMRARAKYGVIPLVRRVIDLNYHTVFITGTGSTIYSLHDLKGTQFAFGDVDSTSAHLMAEYELKQAGINSDTDLNLRYSGSHLATAALVQNGAVDAGAIDKTVFEFLIRSGKVDSKKVRVFATSKPYVDYVFVARKDVPEAQRQRFARALIALKDGRDDSVLKILRAHKFIVAKDEEYASARKIAKELNLF